MPRHVGVAEHSFHWSDERQLVQYLVAADITRVQDQIDTCERLVHARAHETMGVGDEPDEVPFFISHRRYRRSAI
jgi:hypothetical protein